MLRPPSVGSALFRRRPGRLLPPAPGGTALQLAQQRIQALEISFPDLAIGLDPRTRLRQRPGFDPPRPALRVLLDRDQARALQHLQVLRDRGLADLERRCQLGDRGLASREPGEDRPARGVGEGHEGGVEALGGVHPTILEFITYWLYNFSIGVKRPTDTLRRSLSPGRARRAGRAAGTAARRRPHARRTAARGGAADTRGPSGTRRRSGGPSRRRRAPAQPRSPRG